jgi:hypothetical protein
MAPTNLTDLQNAHGLLDLIKFANDNTAGVIGIFMILTFFIITLFISMRKSTFEESLLVASFVGFTFSIGLVAVQLLNWIWILGFLLLMAFDSYYVYKTKNWGFL